MLCVQIPIVSPAEAADLASKYCKQGFRTLKLKVGKNLKADIEVLQAIRAVYPDCHFILDANEGYKPEEAVEVLEKLHGKQCSIYCLMCLNVPSFHNSFFNSLYGERNQYNSIF